MLLFWQFAKISPILGSELKVWHVSISIWCVVCEDLNFLTTLQGDLKGKVVGNMRTVAYVKRRVDAYRKLLSGVRSMSLLPPQRSTDLGGGGWDWDA